MAALDNIVHFRAELNVSKWENKNETAIGLGSHILYENRRMSSNNIKLSVTESEYEVFSILVVCAKQRSRLEIGRDA